MLQRLTNAYEWLTQRLVQRAIHQATAVTQAKRAVVLNTE